MAAGDREVMKAMEEVTTNNVRAAITFGNETRQLVLEQNKKIDSLNGLCQQQQQQIAAMTKQMAGLLAIAYRGGTT